MAFVETKDGVRIHVQDWGQGRPVVLVHGWPVDADMWEYQATFLAEHGLRVVAHDRRGFGRSDQPWDGYDYDTLADDLAAVMDALDLHEATLVGFSMGGGEVVRYLSRHGSARVRGIVLVSAVTPFLMKTDDNPEGVDPSVFDGLVAAIEEDRPHFLGGFGKTFFGVGLLSRAVSPQILDWHTSLALRGSARATRACVRAFSATDFRRDLAAVRVPALIIHGDADAIVPYPASGQRAAQAIAGAKEIVYPGAPHGLYVTEKEKLANHLLAFARA